ncbi:nucleotidyltransferase domain-containing protein [Sulfitobacter albidus]|nr:nucleotidyltransferase domain-containing protein [Sulfitobacter albidus]
MSACVLLFGSMARGDSSGTSDVDLLISEETGSIKSERAGRVEVQYTPQKYLLEMSARGDLFAIHLAYEAKVVADPDGFFDSFKKSLKIKSSYAKERESASALAAYLLKRKLSKRQFPIRNKRIAWCVRTILISLLLEDGEIVFSPMRLQELYPDKRIGILLNARRTKIDISGYKKALRWFLEEFGEDEFSRKGLKQLRQVFKQQDNKVAESTIRSLSCSVAFSPYHTRSA